MGMQFGGSGGNSAGSYSGSSSGTTSGTNTGVNVGTQTGTQTGTSTPITTSLWNQGGIDLSSLLGGGGMTPDQRNATDALTKMIGGNQVGTNTDYANSVLGQFVNAPFQTIAPTNANAGTASASTVGSQIQPYLDYLKPIIGQEVNASTNQLTNEAANSANDLLAKYGGSGAFGGGGMATQLGTLAAKTGLGVAQLIPQLEMQGFTTALNPATTDVQSALSASTTNANNTTQANIASKQIAEAAAEANQRAQQTQQAQSIGAIQDFVNNTFGSNSQQAAMLKQLADQGSLSPSQIIAMMQGQVPGFGTSSTGTTSGTNTGVSAGSTTGSMSGSQSGYNSGSQNGSTSGVKI